jgi:hypothetical protein
MYQPTNTFNKIQFTGIKLLGVSALAYHPRFADGGPPVWKHAGVSYLSWTVFYYVHLLVDVLTVTFPFPGYKFRKLFTLLLPGSHSQQIWHISVYPLLMSSIYDIIYLIWCVENHKWSSWHWNPVTVKKLYFIFVLHRFHYSSQLTFHFESKRVI